MQATVETANKRKHRNPLVRTLYNACTRPIKGGLYIHLCLYLYLYIYAYLYIYDTIHIYIYIYICGLSKGALCSGQLLGIYRDATPGLDLAGGPHALVALLGLRRLRRARMLLRWLRPYMVYIKPYKTQRIYGAYDTVYGVIECLERQLAQNNRPLYPKVAHKGARVAHNYRLLAFQVYI